MFVGELMCLFVYFLKKACSKKKTVDDSAVQRDTEQEEFDEDGIPLSPGG